MPDQRTTIPPASCSVPGGCNNKNYPIPFLHTFRYPFALSFSSRSEMGRIVSKPPIPPAIRFVLATMVVNAIGFGIVIPVTPKIVMSLGHASVSEATAIGGWLAFTYAITQFVFSPIVGNLSDRFGRRPVLLASLAGFAIDFLIFAIAPTLAWVFAVRAVAGMFGASSGPGQSVIADLAGPEDRARYFGMLGGAFGFGFILGPALGGLLGSFDHRLPFFVAGGIAGLTCLYGWFVMPETLAPENRRPFDWRRANPVGSLLYVRKLPGIGRIALVYFLWQLATMVYPMTWNYFAIGRYGWSEGLVGISLALIGIVMSTIQIWILPGAIKRWGERQTAIYGALGAGLAMLGYAAAIKGWMAFALLPLMACQSLVFPNLTSMMTRRADATTQGEVQGFASAVMAIGSVAAPIAFNPLQAWFTGPDAPFIFYGAAYVLAGLIALACVPILLNMPRAERADPNLTPE
jgi:MFS transporter, DHA1 family, tetracycline resistance protein